MLIVAGHPLPSQGYFMPPRAGGESMCPGVSLTDSVWPSAVSTWPAKGSVPPSREQGWLSLTSPGSGAVE